MPFRLSDRHGKVNNILRGSCRLIYYSLSSSIAHLPKTFRIDKDSLGEVKVPSSAYYGPFTARAINLYKVTRQKAHINLIRAYVMIKRSAVLANKELKALDRDKAQAIVKSCDEILAGKPTRRVCSRSNQLWRWNRI